MGKAGKLGPPMEKPPTIEVGILGWLRQNLFSGLLNTTLTVLTASLLLLVGRGVLLWSVDEANWKVISGNFSVLIWGRYPSDQAWRLGLSLGLLVVMPSTRPGAGGPRMPQIPHITVAPSEGIC